MFNTSKKYDLIIDKASLECKKYAIYVNNNIPNDFNGKESFIEFIVKNKISDNEAMKQALDEYLEHNESSRPVGTSGFWKSKYTDMIDCLNQLI